MNDNNLIFALEIGTDKMLALVGEISAKDKINILSLGKAGSKKSVKKADIVDVSAAATLAQTAISRAEKECGASPKELYLAVSGSKIAGMQSIGSASASGIDSAVRAEDLERAKNDAKSKTIPENRSYIHRFCCGYFLDGAPCPDPVGKKGSVVEAEYWLMHGDDESISTAMQAVQSFGMNVEQIMHSAIASAYAVTSERQRADGVLVVDIGRGATDYAYIVGNRMRQAGTIPVGGDHISNDISLGLQISFPNAERLKLECGKTILTEEERAQNIWLNGDKAIGDKAVSYLSLNKIICARIEELFTILRRELEPQSSRIPIREIVLTGGVAYTQGIDIVAQTIFNAPCSLGEFRPWIKDSLCRHEYSTAIGLLIKAAEDFDSRKGRQSQRWGLGAISKFWKGK